MSALDKMSDAEIDALYNKHFGDVKKSVVAPQPVKAPSESRAAEAGLQGLGEAATLGYLPQLQGATEAGIDQAAKWLGVGPYAKDAALKAQGFTINQPETSYVSARDAAIKRGQELSKQEPGAYVGGQLLGTALTAGAIPGGGAARGLSFAERLGRGAATGAALGAIQNPGDVTGEVSPLQLKERAQNAALGGALGGAFEPAMLGIEKAAGLAGKALKKYASGLSGVSEKAMETYGLKTKQIDDIIKQSGGDMAEAANQLRDAAQKSLSTKRQELNAQLKKALSTASKKKDLAVSDVLESLEIAKKQLNKTYDAEAINQINIIKYKVLKENPTELTSIKGMNELKQMLQDIASPAYGKSKLGFEVASDAAIAARKAAVIARNELNTAKPNIAEINNKLFDLRNLESELPRNLIESGTPEGALLAVGAGGGGQNRLKLQALEEASGIPMISKAEELAAAKAFGSDSVHPLYTTGKAALGVGTGYALGGKEGSVIGAALSSPAVLRKLIQSKVALQPIASQVKQTILQNPERAQFLINRLRALGD